MKCFRIGDGIGPDYRCSKCHRFGLRLWRQSNAFLDHIELLCAECAEKDQVEAIARYASFHRPWEPSVGDLVPARPTPDGDTFWGHTSGDVEWWYRLDQYADPGRNAARLRIELDHFVAAREQALRDYLRVSNELHAPRG